MASKQPQIGVIDAERRADLLGTFMRSFPIAATGNSIHDLDGIASRLLEKLELAAREAHQVDSDHVATFKPTEAAIFLRAQHLMQRENELLGNHANLMGNRRITSEAALEETYKILEEYHVSNSDWKISKRELDHFKTLLAESEVEKRMLKVYWEAASKYATKADDLAHELGSLYESHISSCQTASFTNQVYRLVCRTGKDWKSIPETEKIHQIISAIGLFLKDRERSRQERSSHEQKLSAKSRIIDDRDNEIARIREKLDSVEGKHKEDMAKAQDKFDAEHNRRLEKERQIEDNWSRKVQKWNGTISDLEAKNKVLEQKVDAFSQPTTFATPEETGKNSAQISKVQKQNVTLKKLLEDGSKKYKALKEEKQSLEEEIKEQLAEVGNQKKVILSLRNSESSVRDGIQKVVQQISQQKDTEIASIKAERRKSQAAHAEQVARNQALEEELKELRRQRQVDTTLIQDSYRDLHEMRNRDIVSRD